MPRKYGRKARYRRKRKIKRRRGYQSRLRDSKINTAVERAALRIAKKEDNKNFQWYRPKLPILSVSHGGQWPTQSWLTRFDGIQDGLACLAGTIGSIKVSNWGGLLENQLAVPPSTSGNETLNTFRVKNVGIDLSFQHQGPYSAVCQIAIVAIPNAAVMSGNIPSLNMFKSVTAQFDGQYAPQLRQDMPYNYRLLGYKATVLPRSKLYTNAHKDTSSNTWVPAVHTVETRRVKLYHTFKGKGRKFTVDPSGVTAQMKDYEIYCIWTSSVDCAVFGQATSKFRLDQPQLQVAS